MIFVYILTPIALAIIVFVVIVAMRPGDFRVVRTATMHAPRHAVFAQVNDLHKWEAWSPWAKLDPTMKQTYDGAPAGTGAIYSWNGNNQVGEGRMTITESRPSDLVRIKLDFIRPFAGTNDVEFSFMPEGNQTVVAWNMTGKQNFMMKAISMFMNMDKMLGGMFEQGLAQMKTVVEGEASHG